MRDMHWYSHQYDLHHVEPSQGCLKLKGAVHILLGTVYVWGLYAACAESTPSPFSFTLSCGQWSDRPVHHHGDTQPLLTSVKPPLTAASSTHHCHIESALPHLCRRCSHSGWPVLQYNSLRLGKGSKVSFCIPRVKTSRCWLFPVVTNVCQACVTLEICVYLIASCVCVHYSISCEHYNMKV
jgi:hypothetical protein